MPAFDPNLVLDTNPKVRAANAYQAVLDYVQSRLLSPDFSTFLAALASAGLPTDSDDILALEHPFRYVGGVTAFAFNYVSQFPINPSPIAGASDTVTALRVFGNLLVTGSPTGNVTVGNSCSVGGTLSVTSTASLGATNVIGDLDVNGGITFGVGGALKVGGSGLPTIVGGGAFADLVQAAYFRLTGTQSLASASNGDLFEDSNGDLFYQNQSGRVIPLNRPTHDTGWLDVSALPAPAAVPDIHSLISPQILQLTAAPGEAGGPVRMTVWVKVDKSLVDGLSPATGTFYYFLLHASSSSGAVFTGVNAYIDSVTGFLNIQAPAAPNVLIPGTTIDVTSTPAPEVRVMIWTR